MSQPDQVVPQATSSIGGSATPAAGHASVGGREQRLLPAPHGWHSGRSFTGEPRTNVGDTERWVSGAAGSLLALLGLRRRNLTGLLIAGVGGALLHRGVTGRCAAYETLGIDTSDGGGPWGGGVSVEVHESFLINKSPQALYGYWRDFENLPNILTHLQSVQVVDGHRSHWIANAPGIVGGQVSWDAEITQDDPNERISWRSLPGGDVQHRGSVHFAAAPGDRGTAMHVLVDYRPPAGQFGRWTAKLFGEEPEQQIRDDLRNFKRVMETGELPTTDGQPHGTCLGR